LMAKPVGKPSPWMMKKARYKKLVAVSPIVDMVARPRKNTMTKLVVAVKLVAMSLIVEEVAMPRKVARPRKDMTGAGLEMKAARALRVKLVAVSPIVDRVAKPKKNSMTKLVVAAKLVAVSLIVGAMPRKVARTKLVVAAKLVAVSLIVGAMPRKVARPRKGAEVTGLEMKAARYKLVRWKKAKALTKGKMILCGQGCERSMPMLAENTLLPATSGGAICEGGGLLQATIGRASRRSQSEAQRPRRDRSRSPGPQRNLHIATKKCKHSGKAGWEARADMAALSSIYIYI